MNAYARPVLMALAAIALAVSLTSLYIHHRMLVDPSYVSPCDISETVTCQAVYLSSYGTAFGVPVAAGGAIWSALVLLLAALGLASKDKERASAAAGYTFVLSVIGLAAVFYFAYASFFVIGKLCVLCATMYAMVIGIFLISSRLATLSLASLPARLMRDTRAVFTRPAAATLTVLWLIGSVSLIAYFREEPSSSTQNGTSAVSAPAPVEQLEQAQLDEWHAWLDRQPRAPELAPQGEVKVLLVKYNDYQCPSCRQSYFLYKDSIAKFEQRYPGVFKFEARDYPLNPECGIGGAHPNACEAAVAVRLAREHNHGPEMENWLFEHQEEQTRDTIKAALQRIAGVAPAEYESKYKAILPKLHESALLGQKLGVTGTPTFFLNGIKFSTVRASHLEEAIAYELKKAGVS